MERKDFCVGSKFAPNRTGQSRRNFICFCLRVSQLELSIFAQVLNHMHELHRTPGYQKSLGKQPKTKGVYLCHPGTSIKVLLITQGATLHLLLSLLLMFYLLHTSFKQSQLIQRP